MKKTVTIKLKLEDQYDESELRMVMNARQAYSALSEILAEIFRPARDHGYDDVKINKCIETLDKVGHRPTNDEDYDAPSSQNLIALLEDKFSRILEENNINYEDIQ